MARLPEEHLMFSSQEVNLDTIRNANSYDLAVMNEDIKSHIREDLINYMTPRIRLNVQDSMANLTRIYTTGFFMMTKGEFKDYMYREFNVHPDAFNGASNRDVNPGIAHPIDMGARNPWDIT